MVSPYAAVMSADTSTTWGPEGRTDMEWGILRGIAAFRWLAWIWAATVLVVTRADLERGTAAAGLLGVALAINVIGTEASIRRRRFLFHPGTVAMEVTFGAAIVFADGWIYHSAHGQTFGSAWPVAGVLTAGVALGPTGGGIGGLLLGLGRWRGATFAPFSEASTLGLISSTVLYTMAGVAAGLAMGPIRQAESAVARARAREEVARTLHDGVLQTLAVVQRRSTDPDLATLAREQELDLRSYLAGDRSLVPGLAGALRHVAAKVERRDGVRTEVLMVTDEHAPIDAAVIEALSGAVGEALTNAAKHGGAGRATVFVDVDSEVFVSVKDDGTGFDPRSTDEGLGLTVSVRSRVREIGGRAEVRSRPGAGTEVVLHAPLRAPRRLNPRPEGSARPVDPPPGGPG